MLPKYAEWEIERRFVVDVSKLPPLDESQVRIIEDLYLEGGRLRLRSITSTGEEPVYKLCKKYGPVSVGREPITNLYLTAEEHAAFAPLPGWRVKKRRFKVVFEGTTFAVDVFGDGLIIAEVEAESWEAIEGIALPEWIGKEITGDPAFSGANLARRAS